MPLNTRFHTPRHTPHHTLLQIFYFIGITLLSIALGIQIIVLPWLVLDYLSLSSVWVGWLQAAVLLPNLSLLLIGGLMADKGKGLTWLVPVLVINILTHAMLLIVIEKLWLSVILLLIYGLILGVTNAFIQPWREHLLKSVFDQSNGGLQSHVARSTLGLYLGQAIGVAFASLMDDIGVVFLLSGQIIALVIAAISFGCLLRCLVKADVTNAEPCIESELGRKGQYNHRQPLSIVSGLHEVWQLPALRSLVIIAGFNGFFHIGVFIVVLPLIVQQLYGQTVDFYSALQFTFLVGTITATLVVLFKKFLDSPGRRIIFGLLYGGVILLSLSAKPTLTGLFILLFLWGLVVGVSVNMGRALLQSLAPESSRGRIISVYQLALFGSAPLGALFAGYIIDILGIIQLLKISGIASLLFFGLFLMTRALWEVDTEAKV